METKRNQKPSKNVKTLRTKSLSAKRANRVKGGATHSDIVVTKKIDKSSP